jgi:DNA processing protein
LIIINTPEMNNREATIALNMLPKIGPVRVRRLLELLGSADEILKAPLNTLTRASGIGAETAKIINHWEDHIDLTKELDEAKSRDLSIITEEDEEYPAPLRNMYDPPLALYIWGTLSPRDNHAISIVGSRKTSNYGRETARKLALQLASAGLTIVSGMARGIDTYAHEGAIASGKNGRTIAVLGSGLGQIYPPENMALAEKIATSHGAIVSEFPIHQAPDKKTFPMRNRIVAAWADATLVVECPMWSGSMITANLATEMGKPIYAVPGPIDRPTSAGCNHLIREGATLVSKAEDILDDLSALPLIDMPHREPLDIPEIDLTSLSETESLIYQHLSAEEITIDQLVAVTQLKIPALLPALLTLEMKKIITQLPGPRYKTR